MTPLRPWSRRVPCEYYRVPCEYCHAAAVPAIDPRRGAIRCGHHSQVVNVDPPLDTVLPVVLYVLALLLMVVGGTLVT